MKIRSLTTLLASTLYGAVLLAGQAAWADNGRFSLATGIEYSTGEYDTARATDILSSPVIGKYATGPWLFKLSAPIVRFSGMGGVAPGTGRIKASGATGSTQAGLGDAVAAATYNLYEDSASSRGVDVTGKIKLATSDANPGVEANDYAAQMDVYQSLDKFTATGTLGSKVLGSPSGITLNPVLYGSFGGVYQFTKQTSGGIDMSMAQSPSTTAAGQQELTAYVSYKIDKHFKAQGYVLKGFADGGPDKGVGALFSYGF
ncbi:MAG: hypothetical protein ABI479_11635 [Gallionella sp.]